jgi:uncharacterized membrane protein
MTEQEKKPEEQQSSLLEGKINIANTGLVIIVMATVLVGYWMIGQTVAVEGDGIKQKLNTVATEVETIKHELASIRNSMASTSVPAAPQAPAAKAAAQADAEKSAEAVAQADTAKAAPEKPEAPPAEK